MTWDDYFIEIANVVRRKSKDPSSQIGAVIVGPEKQIISTGYNDFPWGVKNTDERWKRPLKYEYIVHAERNAIYNAVKHGISLRHSTLYLVGMGPPTYPCIDCAKSIIQSGIERIVGAGFKPLPENWIENLRKSKEMLDEAGIVFQEVTL